MTWVIKQRLKYFLQAYPTVNVDYLWKSIQSYQIVSFDIFDTLIKRDISNPTDVFKLLERRNGIEDFANRRIKAESVAVAAEGAKTDLTDIYAHITSSEDNARKLAQEEINLELELCRSNDKLHEIYDRCQKAGKKILIISDMYLPAKVIKQILKNAGYRGFENLFVSNEVGSDKLSGQLFKAIAHVDGIDTDKWIHVGDSIKADVWGAKRAGIKAVQISKYDRQISNRSLLQPNLDESFITAFINNRCDEISENPYFSFGFETFGQLLFGFTKWLNKNLEEKGIKKVFFLSRDGFIMERAFSKMNFEKNYETHYIHVSRQSVKVPYLSQTKTLNDVLDVLDLPPFFSVQTFFSAINLQASDYNSFLLKNNVDLNESVAQADFKKRDVYLKLFEAVKLDMWQNANDQLKLFKKYLVDANFNGKVAIVDIGWKGSMQHFLTKELTDMNIDVDITGFYFGLVSAAKKFGIKGKAYVFDQLNNSNDVDLTTSMQGLTEMMFFSGEGSTKSYRLENKKVVPELFDYEYEGTGHKVERDKVEQIQAGAIFLLEKLRDSKVAEMINLNGKQAFRPFHRIGTNPSAKDIELFADFEFFDHSFVPLAAPLSVGTYIKQPNRFKRDLSASRWKIGFLRRLFKLPLPYRWSYDLVKRLRHKN
ncbi:hypothetical protein FD35_GL002098 [Furfurilactobacillus rossiae DSM 15814]|uniref:Uncharacterized protein n=1 Tax=Furfurilactobacillus rossiae DSM 15814 TaxID=1114972 RepID=A0A0R1RJK3_9LACO|nr:hypothetical protein FD35_GL002098 [Furfurilactobacillus rossiae DSM 15814]